MGRYLIFGVLLSSSVAAAAPPLTLRAGSVNATITAEEDASAGNFGNVGSLAPDLAVGVTDSLTLSLIHSTFGRTGFRGTAGAGFCATDACAHAYDNAGIEALYGARTGTLSLAVVGGLHAWSFDRDHYVVKVGGRARYIAGRVTLQTLPALTLAVTERDAMTPNRDRLWLPVTAMVAAGAGVSAGIGTGFKAPLDAVGEGYEVAAGLLLTYAYSPKLGFGASWVHGKIIGGDMALPGDASGIDSRAINVWVSATH